MNDPMTRTSPLAYTRAAGILGLLILFAGIFAEGFVRGQVIVSGDAAATVQNILAAESLFRLGFAAELVMFICDIALAVLLYVLLRPVSQPLALLAMLLRVAAVLVLGVVALSHIGVLLFLDRADYLAAFQTDQLHAFAMLALKAHTYGYHISLVFFGCHLAVLAYLVLKSTYLPRWIGWLLILAAGCYLTNSFSHALVPEFSAGLFPYILLPPMIGETALTVWLLFKGVNQDAWVKKSKFA